MAEHGTKWFWMVFIATLGEYTVLKSLLYYSQENKSVNWVSIRFKHIFNVEAVIVFNNVWSCSVIYFHFIVKLLACLFFWVLLSYDDYFYNAKDFEQTTSTQRITNAWVSIKKRNPTPVKSCFTQNGNVTLLYNMVYSLNKSLCLKRSKIIFL